MNYDETYHHDGIECPYCGYLTRDDLPYQSEGETIDWDCEDCGKTFELNIYCQFSFTGVPKGDTEVTDLASNDSGNLTERDQSAPKPPNLSNKDRKE